MEQLKQYLDDGWFAVPEKDDCSRPEEYAQSFDASACIRTAIPALVCDLFPKAETSIWYYRPFRSNLTADSGHRIILSFERVVCLCEIWVNGCFIDRHLHSEEAFSVDITDALKDGENLIACRVYGPVTGKIGPMGIAMDSVPNYAQVYSYYTVISKTGIYGHVSLEKRGLVYIQDCHIRPDHKTGLVTSELTVRSDLNIESDITIKYTITDRSQCIAEEKISTKLQPMSDTIISLSATLEQFELWSPEDPKLYGINIGITSSAGLAETFNRRIGFKDFRVENGYFMLNGKRIWLSCAHSMATREAIVHAKTMGFGALRFLSEMPSSELLDFCDEIGMMVYEECAVSWGMSDYPDMEAHMHSYLDNMIRRDRNHVCVGIWGVFNEQPGPNVGRSHPRIPQTSAVFETAVNYLPAMRTLDPTRLILLSSGRWDARADIGSYANPGSSVWEYGWGAEGPGASVCAPGTGNPHLEPYITEVGDNHLYPTVPLQNEIRDFVRRIGEKTNPVFLSEYGVGYQLALHDLYADLVSHSHPDHPSIPYYQIQIDKLEEWITHFDLSHVYATPREFLMASVQAGAKQRAESIDPIRANPKLCGYSLTSFSVGNEGVYYRDGGFIPGLVDVLRDSFAPLKWAFFMDSSQLYPNTPFSVEAVLCNADVLEAGSFSAVVSVRGAQGVCFKESVLFTYPAGKPLAASVMKIDLPGFEPGDYTFSVFVDSIRQPTCETTHFRVHESIPGALHQTIGIIGDIGTTTDFLSGLGAVIVSDYADADTICVGTVAAEKRAETAKTVTELAWNGKRVVILDDSLWENINTSAQAFMETIQFSEDSQQSAAVNFGSRVYIRNWLYHMDNYIADSQVFDGLSSPGLLDMDMFRLVYPDHYMVNPDKPSKTYCAAYGSGMFVENACLSALTLGEYTLGAGSVVVSTFKLLGQIGSDPVADRLLYNLLSK